MRVVWAVCDIGGRTVATFDYPRKADAEALAAALKAKGKGSHFVRSVKEPMDSGLPLALALDLVAEDAGRDQRLMHQSNGPGSQWASATTARAASTSGRGRPRGRRARGRSPGRPGRSARPWGRGPVLVRTAQARRSANSLSVRPGQAAQTRTPVPRSS